MRDISYIGTELDPRTWDISYGRAGTHDANSALHPQVSSRRMDVCSGGGFGKQARHPWDPNNPDLRGFNFESPTEEAILKNLPEALERFLSSLGFVVHGPVLIDRDHYADILNLWPAMCC
jgi:hypothetical protein